MVRDWEIAAELVSHIRPKIEMHPWFDLRVVGPSDQ
jgi:hypothetical protein